MCDFNPSRSPSCRPICNLYWNAGQVIPNDPGELVNPDDDASALVADPQLPSLVGLVRPVWMPGSGLFAGGHSRIAEAFIDLATSHAQIGAASAAIDQARADQMPADDILGRPRGSAADVGAWERSASGLVFADGFE
ncbi:MAG: hypothetical protein R3F18_06040 [Lysobacterales bacterium]